MFLYRVMCITGVVKVDSYQYASLGSLQASLFLFLASSIIFYISLLPPKLETLLSPISLVRSLIRRHPLCIVPRPCVVTFLLSCFIQLPQDVYSHLKIWSSHRCLFSLRMDAASSSRFCMASICTMCPAPFIQSLLSGLFETVCGAWL